MSFDYKAMLLLHCSFMVLLMAHGFLPLTALVSILSVLAIGAISASIWNRRRAGWKWRRPNLRGVIGFVGTWALMAIFLFVSIQLVGDNQNLKIVWIFGILNFTVVFSLQNLNTVRVSAAQFAKDCADNESQVPDPNERKGPFWKRVLHAVYSFLFLSIWLVGMYFFYNQSQMLSSAEDAPPGTPMTEYVDNGEAILVTVSAKALHDQLSAVFFIGMPLIMGIGVFLQFVLKVNVLGFGQHREGG
ncbi:MAG: hypothetical protein AAFX86_03710 [Pseudomonadota bacterium]